MTKIAPHLSIFCVLGMARLETLPFPSLSLFYISLQLSFTSCPLPHFAPEGHLVAQCIGFDFWDLYSKTYWPAGGGRGQNPENTAQGHSGQNAIRPPGQPP